MAYANTFKRWELKFLLDEKQYELVRGFIESFMTMDSYGLSAVRNIYLDNENFDMVRNSISKPEFKQKVRLRSYGDVTDDSTAFLEIKKKYRGIVYKRRLEMDYGALYDYINTGTIPDNISDKQVFGEVDYLMKKMNLFPRAVVIFDRTAWYGNDNREFRVTFDGNIRCRTGDTDLRSDSPCEPIPGQPFRVMEIKTAGAVPFALARFLSENRFFTGSYSKYGSYYKKILIKTESRLTENV